MSRTYPSDQYTSCDAYTADGDIYGSEGQYVRYEEGDWNDEADDEHYQDVSSGRPFPDPRGGRPGSARPGRSCGVDRYSDDNMAGPGRAYITPETSPPLQAAAQVGVATSACQIINMDTTAWHCLKRSQSLHTGVYLVVKIHGCPPHKLVVAPSTLGSEGLVLGFGACEVMQPCPSYKMQWWVAKYAGLVLISRLSLTVWCSP